MNKYKVTSANLLIGLLILVSLACNFSFRKADLNEDYKIAYEADSGLSRHIAVMKADGSDPLSLTRTFGLARSEYPVWSPDGTQIAFIHDRNIYVMKSNGSDQTPLTDGPAGSGGMVWSPDGSTNAFTTEVRASDRQLWSQLFVIKPNSTV